MASITYWVVMIIVTVVVFHKMLEAADHNMLGEEKINGKWEQISRPDHYTFAGTYFCYLLIATIIVFLLYFGSAYILDISGYADKWSINTDFWALFGVMGKT